MAVHEKTGFTVAELNNVIVMGPDSPEIFSRLYLGHFTEHGGNLTFPPQDAHFNDSSNSIFLLPDGQLCRPVGIIVIIITNFKTKFNIVTIDKSDLKRSNMRLRC